MGEGRIISQHEMMEARFKALEAESVALQNGLIGAIKNMKMIGWSVVILGLSHIVHMLTH